MNCDEVSFGKIIFKNPFFPWEYQKLAHIFPQGGIES